MKKNNIIQKIEHIAKTKKISLEWLSLSKMKKEELEELERACNTPEDTMQKLFEAYENRLPHIANTIKDNYLNVGYYRVLIWRVVMIDA